MALSSTLSLVKFQNSLNKLGSLSFCASTWHNIIFNLHRIKSSHDSLTVPVSCACHLFWGWNYQSYFIFQTYDPKHKLSRKVTSFRASHHPAHMCTQKPQHTLLQTEGLLCSMTWTNHFCQYPIQDWRLLFILEFSCKWFTVAICWKHTLSFLWKSSRSFWCSENNLMSCLINASKSLNL